MTRKQLDFRDLVYTISVSKLCPRLIQRQCHFLLHQLRYQVERTEVANEDLGAYFAFSDTWEWLDCMQNALSY